MDSSLLAPYNDPAAYIIAWHAISGSPDHEMCALTVDRVLHSDEPYILIGDHQIRANHGDPLGLDAGQHFWAYHNGRYVQLYDPDSASVGHVDENVKSEIQAQLALTRSAQYILNTADASRWVSTYNRILHFSPSGTVLADVLFASPACPRIINLGSQKGPRLLQITREGSLWFISTNYGSTSITYRLWRLTKGLKLNYIDLPKDAQFKAVSSEMSDLIWAMGTAKQHVIIYRFTVSRGDSTLTP